MSRSGGILDEEIGRGSLKYIQDHLHEIPLGYSIHEQLNMIVHRTAGFSNHGVHAVGFEQPKGVRLPVSMANAGEFIVHITNDEPCHVRLVSTYAGIDLCSSARDSLVHFAVKDDLLFKFDHSGMEVDSFVLDYIASKPEIRCSCVSCHHWTVGDERTRSVFCVKTSKPFFVGLSTSGNNNNNNDGDNDALR
jgi:hypothetical protein